MSASPPATDLIPVTVLTGFLGSGKTTVLNHLLRQPELSDAAVLINEFGEIGLDHDLVRAIEDDIVLLNAGCLCCTVRGDLVTALRDLYLKRVRGDVPEFRRIVIETTGLADPAPILHTIMTDPLISARYRLDGIVATVDAVNAMSELDRHAEAVKQVAVADRIILTKTDLHGDAGPLLARLRTINPAAPVTRAIDGKVDPEDVLDAGLFSTRGKSPDVEAWLREEAVRAHHHHEAHDHGHGHSHDVNRHDDRISAFSLSIDGEVDWDAFVSAIEMLVASKGADVLRVKGILNVKGQDSPVVVHGVQHVFHPPAQLDAWPRGEKRSRIVFITRDTSPEVIRRLFASALELPVT